MDQALSREHFRASADVIRQQPEYKSIISRQNFNSEISNPSTLHTSLIPASLRGSFRPDSLVAKQKHSQSSCPKRQSVGRHELPIQRSPSILRRPTTCPVSSSSRDTSQVPRSFSQQVHTGACVGNVILRRDEDMGLSGKTQKHRRRFSWQERILSHDFDSSQRRHHNSQAKPKPILVCNKLAQDNHRPQAVHFPKSLQSTKKTFTKAPCSMTKVADSRTISMKDTVNETHNSRCLAAGDSEDSLKGCWNGDNSSFLEDEIETVAKDGVLSEKTTDSVDNTNPRSEIIVDVLESGVQNERTLSPQPFQREPPISMIEDTDTVGCNAIERVPTVLPCEENRATKTFAKSKSSSVPALVGVDEHIMSCRPEETVDDRRANAIKSTDAAVFGDQANHTAMRPPLKRTQSTGNLRAPSRPHDSLGEHAASGYDAKLEKSAVYLHAKSKTFTRASQYMTGGHRPGLSLLNVHYSQTNTGFNDRIIFADLLKSAHVSNAVIGDSVFTMERRLYSRRQDPSRCTTFFDRFAGTTASASGKRRRSKSTSDVHRGEVSSGETTVVTSSARTVAGKEKARKARIRRKKEQMAMGYTPTMSNMAAPTSKDMDDMLLSCRYLRVQPCRQPWLYDSLESLDV